MYYFESDSTKKELLSFLKKCSTVYKVPKTAQTELFFLDSVFLGFRGIHLEFGWQTLSCSDASLVADDVKTFSFDTMSKLVRAFPVKEN